MPHTTTAEGVISIWDNEQKLAGVLTRINGQQILFKCTEMGAEEIAELISGRSLAANQFAFDHVNQNDNGTF